MMENKYIPTVKGPSEIKKDPTVMPSAARNLKNQNLEKNKT